MACPATERKCKGSGIWVVQGCRGAAMDGQTSSESSNINTSALASGWNKCTCCGSPEQLGLGGPIAFVAAVKPYLLAQKAGADTNVYRGIDRFMVNHTSSFYLSSGKISESVSDVPIKKLLLF